MKRVPVNLKIGRCPKFTFQNRWIRFATIIQNSSMFFLVAKAGGASSSWIKDLS